MRVLIAITACVLTIATAQAQEAAPWRPVWIERPTPALVEQAFPKFLYENAPGLAVLCCIPNGLGQLSCNVAAESHEGRGVGAAGLILSTGYRMSRASVAEFRAGNMAPYELRIPFVVMPDSRRRREAMQCLEQTLLKPDMCKPQAP